MKNSNVEVFDMERALKQMQQFGGLKYIVQYPFDAMDALRLFIGPRIANGQYRVVYDCELIKNAVIKYSADNDHNQIEWHVWQAVKDQPYAKWLAPCLHISPTGHFLIQRKVRPIKLSDKLPKKIPAFLDDIKFSNFGWIGSQLACHDYQFLLKVFDLASNVNMRQVNWKEIWEKYKDR